MTGRIYIDLFLTLDGVAQAPGGPDEDRESGFPFGGWQAPLIGEVDGRSVGEGIAAMDALVLGRKTYDIFASYWPQHTGADAPIAQTFNRIPKYVASRHPLALDWAGTSQLGPDAVADVVALRDKHERIHVIGSIDFVQSLLAAGAYDELSLWVYPVVLGQGKKLFPDGAAPATMTLLERPLVSAQGAVLLRYGPAGEVRTGDMGADDRGL
ncbi:dihydrofolate reductase family protein [Microbacterium terregens]|uniref:Dihydrofolate reductase family protein n=1 Tax=Microbacterium terregens TaxID=69363 RepID=A0ABV5SZ83_9MICO